MATGQWFASESGGSGIWALSESAASAPNAPTTVAGTATGATTATLTWVDASSDETSFTVQVRTAAGPGAWGNAAGATNPTAANVQSFAATGLTAATAYDVRVKASNGSGDSAYVQSASSFTTDNPGGGGGSIGILVPLGALALTGYAPTVTATNHQIVAVPAGSLTLTGYAPTVTFDNNQTVQVPAGALTITGYAPEITGATTTIEVPAGSLTLTGYAPTVSDGAVTVSLGGPRKRRRMADPMMQAQRLHAALWALDEDDTAVAWAAPVAPQRLAVTLSAADEADGLIARARAVVYVSGGLRRHKAPGSDVRDMIAQLERDLAVLKERIQA